MATVLYMLAETIRQLAILIQPFMPDASARILDQLAVADGRAQLRELRRARHGAPARHGPADADGVFPRFAEQAA